MSARNDNDNGWAVVICREAAGLRLRFPCPIQDLDLSPDAARQLAARLVVLAEKAESSAEPTADLEALYIRARCEGDERQIRELEAAMTARDGAP